MSCTSRIINRTRHGSLDINLQPEVELHNVYVRIAQIRHYHLNHHKYILHFQIMTTLYYKFRTIYRPHLIKVESELCKFLKDNSTSKVLLIVAGMWKRVGNFLDPCPVKVQKRRETFPYTSII